MNIMTMMRISVMNMGIYLVIGIVLASIFRLTSFYSAFKLKYTLLQPNLYDIFWEIMFWPFLLLLLIVLFSTSLVDLLCEIGNCIAQVSKKWRREKLSNKIEPIN